MPGNALRLEEILAYAQNIVDTVRDPLLILSGDLRVRSANHAFYEAFQLPVAETELQPLTSLSDGLWNVPELVALLTDTVTTRDSFDNFELEGIVPRIGWRVLLLNGRKLIRPDNDTTLLVLSIEDITARRATETGLSVGQVQDKKIALALQRPMLFQPKEDAFSGLAVQTAYAMASDEALVGGDFWDTFAFNREHVAFVLGDVMGHGLTSAIFTAELKYAMRAYIREHIQPALVLYRMNEYLCESNRLFQEGANTEGSEAPVCIAIAVIVKDTGAGALATAGMEPPIIVRANGDIESSGVGGMPLGVIEAGAYQQFYFQLNIGDTLLLTTDGITEARRGHEFLETEGLMRLAVEGNGRTLTDMAQTILEGATGFAGGKLKDDASIVLVRRIAVASPEELASI